MAKFKFTPVAEVEDSKAEAERTGEPVKRKGVGTAGTPRLEPEEALELAKKLPVETRVIQGPISSITSEAIREARTKREARVTTPAGDNEASLAFMSTTTKQLADLGERLKRIEMIVTAHWPRDTEKFPKTTNGGHPVTPSGIVAPWKETPSGDQLLKAAHAYVEKNGKKKYRELLAEFQATQLSDVEGEERQAGLMEKLNG